MTPENQNIHLSSNQPSQETKITKNNKKQLSDSYLKKWSVPENILYGRYLKTHMGQMSNKKKKKCGKFVKMANFIGSKSENQCRSHHQKMLLTFKSLQNIIRYVGQVKRRGQLISLEQYQNRFGLDLGKQTKNKESEKIEEQLSTERQSQQQEKDQKNQLLLDNRKSEQEWQSLPILEEESKTIRHEDEGIFDVLDVQIYSDFFLC